MMTTAELVELLELAAAQGRRALRIEEDLFKDPGPALSVAKHTMKAALDALEARVPAAAGR